MLKVGHTTQNVCSRVSPLPATLCTWFLSRIQLFATSGTVAHKPPLSLERFSRQEYWSGLPFPSPGDLRLKSSNSDPKVPCCKMRSVSSSGSCPQSIPAFQAHTPPSTPQPARHNCSLIQAKHTHTGSSPHVDSSKATLAYFLSVSVESEKEIQKCKSQHNKVPPLTHKPEWPLLKCLQITNAREGVEKREPSCTVNGNVNQFSRSGEQYEGSFKHYKQSCHQFSSVQFSCSAVSDSL